MRTASPILGVSTIVLLAGCANMGVHPWKSVTESSYAVPAQGYATVLPQGWIAQSSGDYSDTLLSRQGLDLEFIQLLRADNAKAFPQLKKGATVDELPADLAGDYIAEAKLASGATVFNIIQNEPAKLGGKDGFHLAFEYSSQDGVRYRQEVYAACTADGFYVLRYRAPVLYYFGQYQPVFASVVTGFQFIPLKKSAHG